ncbi:MAG: M15 family metallopeptidase [Patescibacteria group bacterium]
MDLISKKMRILLAVLVVVILGAIGYLGHDNYQIKKHGESLEKEIMSAKKEFASTTQSLNDVINLLGQNFVQTTKDRENAEQNIQNELKKVGSIETQVKDIAGTVSTLDKLTKLDPELLQKYSKIFFLNENYVPPRLSIIDPKYISETKKNLLLRDEVLPFLHLLLDNATNAGIDIKIFSAYRSFDEQSKLKDSYTIVYGVGTANQFSADQGYSEHQLGTTVDFTTSSNGATLSAFKKTGAYAWLLENAYKYGFILSYPEGNKYYIYESWHWRFIGRKLAEKLHNEEKYFYNLDQREIDQYLVNIFD